MQEKHPIDDLFRRALSEAEVTPPASVWEGVVRHRSWGHRLLARLERRWWLSLLLLLLVGSTTALMWVNDGSHPAALGDPAGTPEQAHAIPSPAAGPPAGAARLENAAGSAITRAPEMSGTPPRPESTSSALTDRSHERSPSMSHYPITNSPGDQGIAASHSTSESEGMLVPGSEHELAVLDPVAEAVLDVRAVETLERQASRSISHPLRVGGTPRSASATSDYVVSNGNWFLGFEAGVAMLNGSWQGDVPTVKPLNSSEDPLDQGHVQLLVGRKWNNGFHIALGIGAAKRTTRFLSSNEGQNEVIEQTDTTWSPIPLGAATYYTWDIDTVLLAEPGVGRSYSATNSYTAGRVGVELGHSWQTHRWVLGVDLGLQAHFSERRQGQTYALEEPASNDGTGSISSVVAVPFDQASMDTRTFGLSGSLSLDFGYLLGDRVSLHLLPYYQRDLSGMGADPWLRTSAFGGAVRLMYSVSAPARPKSPAER